LPPVVSRRLCALASVPLLIVGCGTGASPSQPTSSQQQSAPTLSDVPPPLVPAAPLPPNAVDDAVAKLDGLVQDLMTKSGIPGMSVAVVHGGKTVYAKGFGVKDIRAGDGAGNKVDPDTVFQLASLSKSISATVVAEQVTAKAIGWDTRIAEKLPWFALSDPAVTGMLTVGDLFSHRSGLPDHAGDKLEDLGYDRRQVLDKLRQLPLDPFRISYAYTNFGLTAGAEAVAAAAGKPWEDLAQDVLYGPLGMTSTSSRYADYANRPDRTVAHLLVDGKYEPRFVRDADAQTPAGGVSGSVNDVAKWLTMMLADGTVDGKQVISPEALLPALTPQVLSAPPAEPAMRSGFYGYGFNLGVTSAARTQISHSGAFETGAATNYLILPSADVAIVALTNATPTGIPETLTAEFADLVQFGEIREDWEALYEKAFQPMTAPEGSLVGKQPPASPAPAAPPATYVGTYDNPYWGPARVTEANGALTLTLGPRNLALPLTHWDGNTYTFGLLTENAPPGTVSKATFDGDRLTLEYYDDVDGGVFTKAAP
jgi:CubicO group peptidase (beta-lactamase class C family)